MAESVAVQSEFSSLLLKKARGDQTQTGHSQHSGETTLSLWFAMHAAQYDIHCSLGLCTTASTRSLCQDSCVAGLAQSSRARESRAC